MFNMIIDRKSSSYSNIKATNGKFAFNVKKDTETANVVQGGNCYNFNFKSEISLQFY